MPSGVLALDLGSGGATAARFDSALAVENIREEPWACLAGPGSAATLGALQILSTVESALGRLSENRPPPNAIVLSSMMHSLLLADPDGEPLSPVFTWMDRTSFPDEDRFRQAVGESYTSRTGARVHPSYPASRLARLARAGQAPETSRVHSIPSWILARWVGQPAEDVSTASASGLLNLATGAWDPETLSALGLDAARLPPIVPPGTIAGRLSSDTAARTGIPTATPVVVAGGDGFLAALGSGCRRPGQVSVTLGTSAAVRRFEPRPRNVSASGLFCYRQDRDHYLVGAAGNNGGNVLDWVRRALPEPDTEDPPLFLPFVFGERTPFWDATLRPRWSGVAPGHTPADLAAAVPEGVAFGLAFHCRLVEETGPAETGILSGNGFGTPDLDRILATIAGFPILRPPEPGLATLRGAAILGLRALGLDPPIEPDARPVTPFEDDRAVAIRARFVRFADLYESNPIT